MSKTLGTSLRVAVLASGFAALLANGANLLAQKAPIPFLNPDAASLVGLPPKGGVRIEVLTDTQGIDFRPYIKQVVQTILQDARSVKATTGSATESSTVLTFTINRDRKVIALHLDDSSDNNGLDHAAWAAISQTQSLPAFPRGFTGSSLSLRVRIPHLEDKS